MPVKFSIGKNPKPNKLSSLLGGIICLVLSALGFYVAIHAKNIEGGIPFIAESANRVIGQIVFGTGAVITGILALAAFSEFFRKEK